MIIVSKSSEDAGNDQEGDSLSGTVTTLYKAVKSLQKSGTADAISITGHGSLQPHSSGPGKHGYQAEFPPGHAKHVSYAYLPKVEEESQTKNDKSGTSPSH